MTHPINTSPEAIAALLDGVTPGPWEQDGPILAKIVWAGPDVRVCFMTSDGPASKNARFIAAARYLVPALAAERDALKAEVDLLLWPPLCGQPKITDVYQLLDSADRAHAAMCRSLEMTSTLVGDMADAIRELCADRDAAVARAEQAEARAAELEANVDRLRQKYDDVISDRSYIVGWNAGYNFAEYGDEERDVPDVVSELAAKKQKEQQLAPAEWKAAIEANLTRLTAQARAQGMREAAGMIDPAIFDYPSVFMGGPSHRAKRIVEEIVAPILARADTIDGADNG